MRLFDPSISTRAYSTMALIAILAIGLVVGAGAGYVIRGSGGNTSSSLLTVTSTATTTVLSTFTASTSSSSPSSSSSSSTSSPSLTSQQLEAALKNTQNASLAVTSYNFGKGTLAAWVENSGSAPIVLATQMILFNGTFVENTFITALDPKVLTFGMYYYLPANSTVIVQLTPLTPPLTGRNSTLTILGNTFSFAYGTSKD